MLIFRAHLRPLPKMRWNCPFLRKGKTPLKTTRSKAHGISRNFESLTPCSFQFLKPKTTSLKNTLKNDQNDHFLIASRGSKITHRCAQIWQKLKLEIVSTGGSGPSSKSDGHGLQLIGSEGDLDLAYFWHEIKQIYLPLASKTSVFEDALNLGRGLRSNAPTARHRFSEFSENFQENLVLVPDREERGWPGPFPPVVCWSTTAMSRSTFGRPGVSRTTLKGLEMGLRGHFQRTGQDLSWEARGSLFRLFWV